MPKKGGHVSTVEGQKYSKSRPCCCIHLHPLCPAELKITECPRLGVDKVIVLDGGDRKGMYMCRRPADFVLGRSTSGCWLPPPAEVSITLEPRKVGKCPRPRCAVVDCKTSALGRGALSFSFPNAPFAGLCSQHAKYPKRFVLEDGRKLEREDVVIVNDTGRRGGRAAKGKGKTGRSEVNLAVQGREEEEESNRPQVQQDACTLLKLLAFSVHDARSPDDAHPDTINKFETVLSIINLAKRNSGG